MIFIGKCGGGALIFKTYLPWNLFINLCWKVGGGVLWYDSPTWSCSYKIWGAKIYFGYEINTWSKQVLIIYKIDLHRPLLRLRLQTSEVHKGPRRSTFWKNNLIQLISIIFINFSKTQIEPLIGITAFFLNSERARWARSRHHIYTP